MADDKEKLKFIVGVSSGIYMAARSPELSSVVRKLGFALTRGANAIELGGDVPHEIDYTQGKEVRYIAEKQDLTLLLHGSLTVPMCMPERGEWRDAQTHIQKSVRSAVMGGCKYVNFHACLHYWLEMMTYAGRKLSLTFCDHQGRFIKDVLKESEKLREWFIHRKWDIYGGDVLYNEEQLNARIEASDDTDKVRRSSIEKEFGAALQSITFDADPRRDEQLKDSMLQTALSNNSVSTLIPIEHQERFRKILDKIQSSIVEVSSKNQRESFQKKLREKLVAGRDWDSEELRAAIGIIDGYHIIAHYLYYSNDPIWQKMYEMYKDVIDKNYNTVKFSREDKEYTYSPGSGSDGSKRIDYWIDAAWEKAEQNNDREFKEFYYSVCAAKFIEGHMNKLFDWMKSEKPDGLLGELKNEVKDKDDLKRLEKIAKDLKITLEIPDARSPEYAGLYLICRPKQIYAVVKTISKELDTKKLAMLIDFEHIATQGFDPLNEIKEFVELAPDAGKHILSLHVTKPTPLHHHIQVEIGDVEIYKLLWELTDNAELGKHHDTYLIYERGGDRDPFKQSVTAIKLMVDQLHKGTKPEELVAKPEFFGVAGPALGSEERQRVVIQEHARDPIEGLLVVPEEKYTALGKAATEKAGAEKWKKEELV